MFSAIQRFKSYTCLMSDEALVRLMTSLVTLSLNSFGSTMTYPPSSGMNNMGSTDTNDKNGLGSVPGFNGGGGGSGVSLKTQKNTQQSKSCSLLYLQESINQGAVVSYSLQTVIEVTKLNSFRAACIWQMVTSHLRIIASMKNGGTRYFAVAATLDIVKSTLSECARSRLPSPAPALTKRKVRHVQSVLVYSTLTCNSCNLIRIAGSCSSHQSFAGPRTHTCSTGNLPLGQEHIRRYPAPLERHPPCTSRPQSR